ELAVLAGHDAKQARFSRAVQSEYADLRARKEGERNVLEDDALGRNHLAHAVHRVNVLSHGYSKLEVDCNYRRPSGAALPRRLAGREAGGPPSIIAKMQRAASPPPSQRCGRLLLLARRRGCGVSGGAGPGVFRRFRGDQLAPALLVRVVFRDDYLG